MRTWGHTVIVLVLVELAVGGCGGDVEFQQPGGGGESWDLSRFQLRKEDGTTWVVPNGVVLDPGGYLVVIQGEPDDPDLIVNFLENFGQDFSDNLVIFQTEGGIEVLENRFILLDDAGERLDGLTPAPRLNENIQRLDGNDSDRWERRFGQDQASPGWGQEERPSPDYPYISEVHEGGEVHPVFSYVEIYLGE